GRASRRTRGTRRREGRRRGRSPEVLTRPGSGRARRRRARRIAPDIAPPPRLPSAPVRRARARRLQRWRGRGSWVKALRPIPCQSPNRSPACAETSGGRMARIWLGRLLGAVLACCAASAEAQERNDARQEARALYERIIAFDTSTGPQNVAMAQFLAERFVAGGFAEEDVHIIPANDTVGLLVRYRGDGSVARPILLIAHMDVVPALRSEWARDPFTLVEENGFFFGRGASDNKAGVAHL